MNIFSTFVASDSLSALKQPSDIKDRKGFGSRKWNMFYFVHSLILFFWFHRTSPSSQEPRANGQKAKKQSELQIKKTFIKHASFKDNKLVFQLIAGTDTASDLSETSEMESLRCVFELKQPDLDRKY